MLKAPSFRSFDMKHHHLHHFDNMKKIKMISVQRWCAQLELQELSWVHAVSISLSLLSTLCCCDDEPIHCSSVSLRSKIGPKLTQTVFRRLLEPPAHSRSKPSPLLIFPPCRLLGRTQSVKCLLCPCRPGKFPRVESSK